MTTTDTPRPGPGVIPHPPLRAVPDRDPGPGLNDDGAEARRRIVRDIARECKDIVDNTFDLLTIAAWIETREPFYETEEDES